MSEPKRFVVVDASGAESDIGRFVRDGHSRTLYECDGVAAARCLTKLLNESRPPVVEARSDDAALVLPGDAIAANAALAGIEMERRLAPNRYLEGVRAGLAAAAAENAEALEHWIRMRQSSAETEDWTGVLDAHAKVVEMNDCAHWLAGLRGRAEAIAGAAAAPGADTTPSVATLRAAVARANEQADPAVIEAAAQRFEREADAARAAIWPDSTTAPANGDAAKEERGCR